MPKWTEYTSKDTLADNDEVMLYDATARANKRGLMSKFWDYVVDKMATAVISKLETDNKTIIGAINALNSETKGKTYEFSNGNSSHNVWTKIFDLSVKDYDNISLLLLINSPYGSKSGDSEGGAAGILYINVRFRPLMDNLEGEGIYMKDFKWVTQCGINLDDYVININKSEQSFQFWVRLNMEYARTRVSVLDYATTSGRYAELPDSFVKLETNTTSPVTSSSVISSN
mgnify:CR=1 FL=1